MPRGVSTIKCYVFQKFDFFQIFDWSNLLLNRSKMWQNFRFESAWLDWCWTDRNSVLRCFKKSFLTCSSHFFKNFSNTFHCFFSIDPIWAYFVVFFPIFLNYLCLQVQVRPFYPFFFSLFTIFMHLHAFFSKSFEHGIFGNFDFRVVFNHIWPLDFCS